MSVTCDWSSSRLFATVGNSVGDLLDGPANRGGGLGAADSIAAAIPVDGGPPLPLPLGADETGYRPALAAAAERVGAFRPGFLVVPFGTDAHESDPIGGFKLPTGFYAELAAAVRQLGLPTVVTQEGGYALGTMGECVAGFLGEITDQSDRST